MAHERRNLDGYPAAINRISRWIPIGKRTVTGMAEIAQTVADIYHPRL